MATAKIEAFDNCEKFGCVLSVEATVDAKVYYDSPKNYRCATDFHGIYEEVELDEDSVVVTKVHIDTNWSERVVPFKSLRKANQRRILDLVLSSDRMEVEEDPGYDCPDDYYDDRY